MSGPARLHFLYFRPGPAPRGVLWAALVSTFSIIKLSENDLQTLPSYNSTFIDKVGFKTLQHTEQNVKKTRKYNY